MNRCSSTGEGALHTASSEQSYAPPPHPMAPPSPSTNSCSQGGAEQLSKTNLYIRGLPPGTTDQDLIKLCQPGMRRTTKSSVNQSRSAWPTVGGGFAPNWLVLRQHPGSPSGFALDAQSSSGTQCLPFPDGFVV
ncbi:RNA-binding motif, single-stranded-interacting protein 3 [Liparis tanakae]|uniref:RNA-binding motif, single-stranded-interacting protein 3 n=1 Tax=Liparis tanakae TaxID=230148 RepID=A0A4Z2F4M7_9TELE|nr:RNA-binding motif, single-stranded-interacting protein 3 [Liparis tanakae]